MLPKGEQCRLFLECVQSTGLDLPSLDLTKKCIFLGEQTTCTVGRQNQVELFGRIVPSEQQRQWISRNHFELLQEGSGLSLRRLTGNSLLVDGAPAPQNVAVALRHDSQIGFCAPESTSPFLIFCVRDQQRHAAAPLLLPNSQDGAAKASSSTFTFECTFARGGDPSKLPLEARSFSFASSTPVTVGRQHQVGFFEGLFLQDQQCLSFISRSHFEVTPVPGEVGAATLRNLSQNPIMVGQQQIAKGESCKAQAPTLILFLAGPDHASLACFLKLSLQLVVASPSADSRGKMLSPAAASASSHASTSPQAAAALAASPSSSPAANSPPAAPSGGSAVSNSPAGRSVSPVPPGAAPGSKKSAASPRGTAPPAQVQPAKPGAGVSPQTQILGAAPMTQQLGGPAAAGPPAQQFAAGTGHFGGGGGGGSQQPILTQMLPAQNRPFWLELRGQAVLPGTPPGARRVTTFDGGFTVGRSHQAQMFRQVLRSDALQFVSREHFRIELWGGHFHLIALSSNPVWLVRASDRSRTALGDKQEACAIMTGDCIQFFAGEPEGTRLEDTALYWSFHEGLPPQERDHGVDAASVAHRHQEPAPALPPAQPAYKLPSSTLRPVESAPRSASRGASPSPGSLGQAWPAPRDSSPGRGGAPGVQGYNPASPWGTGEDDWDQDAHDAHWLASALTPRGGAQRG